MNEGVRKGTSTSKRCSCWNSAAWRKKIKNSPLDRLAYSPLFFILFLKSFLSSLVLFIHVSFYRYFYFIFYFSPKKGNTELQPQEKKDQINDQKRAWKMAFLIMTAPGIATFYQSANSETLRLSLVIGSFIAKLICIASSWRKGGLTLRVQLQSISYLSKSLILKLCRTKQRRMRLTSLYFVRSWWSQYEYYALVRESYYQQLVLLKDTPMSWLMVLVQLLLLHLLLLCSTSVDAQYHCRDPDLGGNAPTHKPSSRKFLIIHGRGAGIGNFLVFFPAAYFFAALTGRVSSTFVLLSCCYCYCSTSLTVVLLASSHACFKGLASWGWILDRRDVQCVVLWISKILRVRSCFSFDS